MLITSHLLATLLAGKALKLSHSEIYTAVAFGVGVDIDHFFTNKKWITDVRDYLKERKVTYGVNQHSWAQELLFGTFVATLAGIALSIFSSVRWWVAPLFLLMHIGMDAVMRNEHQPFAPLSRFRYVGWLRSGTAAEILISCIGLLWLISRGWLL